MHSHLSSLGWSPTNPRMVIHQKEVYYRLEIWHLHFTHKTNTRRQLLQMVTFHPSLAQLSSSLLTYFVPNIRVAYFHLGQNKETFHQSTTISKSVSCILYKERILAIILLVFHQPDSSLIACLLNIKES